MIMWRQHQQSQACCQMERPVAPRAKDPDFLLSDSEAGKCVLVGKANFKYPFQHDFVQMEVKHILFEQSPLKTA